MLLLVGRILAKAQAVADELVAEGHAVVATDADVERLTACLADESIAFAAVGGGLAGAERDSVLALIGSLRPALPVHERPMIPGEREEYIEIAKRADPAELADAAKRGLGPAGMVHYVRAKFFNVQNDM